MIVVPGAHYANCAIKSCWTSPGAWSTQKGLHGTGAGSQPVRMSVLIQQTSLRGDVRVTLTGRLWR